MKTLLILSLAIAVTGCGKTLDQIRNTAHNLIDIGGKIYEDVKEDVEIVKEAAKEATKPSDKK